MKLLTLGIRYDGKSSDELRQQLTDGVLLPGIQPDLIDPVRAEYDFPADVLIISLRAEAWQVPGILGHFIAAGCELNFLAFHPAAENGIPKKTAPTPVNFVDSYETATRTMGNLQHDLIKKLLKTTAVSSKKINLPTLNGFRRFELSTIIRCESTDNYTNVYFTDRKKILVSRSLQEFESRLAASGFFRVHHKHLINTEHIVEYHKGKGGQVIMSDNTPIDVSVRKKTEFIRYINDLS